MRVSFVTTVLNEEKTIERLLDSLFTQSRRPDEAVIVDGGSTDQTVEEIKNFKRSHSTTIIYIIIVKGANRARGRNEGIKKASGKIIAISDAGCELDKRWLKKITEPWALQVPPPRGSPLDFARDKPSHNPEVSLGPVDVVAGFYRPIAKSIFEKCLACYTCVMPDKVDPLKFLPSSRSIAFKKSVWEKVGGYPENLDYCEDLIFIKKLKAKGAKFVFVKDALVFWRQRKNIWQAFWQFFNYASGDGQALYWPHLKKIGLVYLRYLAGILILALGLLYDISIYRILTIGLILVYFSWAIAKNYRYVKNPLSFFYLPLLQVTADLAVMSGVVKGLASGIIKPKAWDF